MFGMRKKVSVFAVCVAFVVSVFGAHPAHAKDKLKVVVTASAYASIADAIGGDKIEVSYIVSGNQDPHIVRPKPSLAVKLSEADMFVATGLDLEMWAPSLVDMSNNPKIRSGQKGYVSASAGLDILDVPVTVSRAEGDVHVFGNPHIHTSPLNGKVIAENIYLGLKKNAPEHEAYFKANLEKFKNEVDERLFGKELVKMLGGKTLTKLAGQGRLIPFLKSKEFQGKPLMDSLGGYMKKSLPLRDKEIVTFHKNWTYFTDLFGLRVVDYMEPKPGMPPTPGHVSAVISKMKERNIRVMLVANYFDMGKVKTVARKTGATPVMVALGPGGQKGMNSFFDQFDIWIDELLAAFAQTGS